MKNFNLILEIIGLSILINENTELCVFADYSGHVNKLDISVHPNKESYDHKDKIYSVSLYCVSDFVSDKKILSSLKETKKVLTGYLYGNSIEHVIEFRQQKNLHRRLPTQVSEV
jgi:hypothetical protein